MHDDNKETFNSSNSDKSNLKPHYLQVIKSPLWNQRRGLVSEYCKSHNLELPKPRQLLTQNISQNRKTHFLKIYQNQLTNNIVHVPGLDLNWCLVPKVASTSISSIILPHLKELKKVTQFSHIQKEVWTRAGRLPYSEYELSVNKTPSFLITRHPFARVASAFRNKLEDRSRSHDGEYFYNTWSRQIIRYSFNLSSP